MTGLWLARARDADSRLLSFVDGDLTYGGDLIVAGGRESRVHEVCQTIRLDTAVELFVW